jgi:hypothetical protein
VLLSQDWPLLAADIQTMFYEERQAQLAAAALPRGEGGADGGEANGTGEGPEVHMPIIEHLKVAWTIAPVGSGSCQDV